VGSSAAALRDLRATPLDSAAAGVEVHAMLTEQILHATFLQRPDWVGGAEAAFVALAGLALLGILTRLGALAGAVASVVAAGGAVAASAYAYAGHGLLIDPIMPVVALGTIWAAVSLIGYRQAEQERSQIRHAFTHFLAPSLVEELAADPGRLKLGGTIREMSLLFADIRGFTTLSESLDPETLTGLINRFLSPMSDLILAHRGTIDKFIGDCIMAFWNAPLDDPDHARHGLETALAMRQALAALNRELAREAGAGRGTPIGLGIGIGLNAGKACVGNMGTATRFDYSAIGDTVNLAARLEGLSKLYLVDLVVSEAILARAGGPSTDAWQAIELDLIRAKGKREPVRVFTLLEAGSPDGPSPRQRTLADAVDRLHAAWRAGNWRDAGAALARARGAAEDAREGRLAGLFALYEGRLAERTRQPVPADWDGVSDALDK
jgi:adenylate cyclase